MAKQLDVILQALQQLGIQAEKSGRNDLTANGRKFSGNAFYESGNRCYHHGTLMVQVDREMLGKYLQVSASKLASKGVSSVQSRVVNLAELKEGLTIAQLQQAFGGCHAACVWQTGPAFIQSNGLTKKQIAAYQAEFISDAWRFGQRLPFTWETEHRFGWGNFHLQCAANYGKIEQAIIYSDAMDANLIGQLAEQLQGCDFSSKAMAERLQQLGERTEVQDVCQYLLELNI